MTSSFSRRRLRRLTIDPNLVLSEPKAMTIKAVVGKSLSNIYDEAKVEWELKSVLSEDSVGFSNICELCGNPHLKTNFKIYNPLTDQTLNVGSRCIIRFGLLKGNIDVETGSLIINGFMDLQHFTLQVRALTKSVMILSPEAKDYQMFYEGLKKVLDLRNIKEPTIDDLGRICFTDSKWAQYSEDKIVRSRLHMLWYRPLLINTVKTKVKKDKQYKEGSTFGHKQRTTVYMPGAARTR
ncbi:hypothetical protein [Paenibacillus taichungensis]